MHLKSFFKHRENLEVLETECGFIAWSIEKDVLFCNHFYVAPEFRKQGMGRELLDKISEVAKECGLKKVGCTVQPNHRLNHPTLLATLAGDFILKGLNSQNHLYFEKELK